VTLVNIISILLVWKYEAQNAEKVLQVLAKIISQTETNPYTYITTVAGMIISS